MPNCLSEIAVAAVFLLALQPLAGQTGRPPAGSVDGQEYALYLASVAAADGSLRLHETAAADKWLRLASSDATLRVWDVSTGECVLIAPSSDSVYGTAWSPDGRSVAMLVLNKTLRILEAAPAQVR